MKNITHANTNIETWLINFDKTRTDGLTITSHDCEHDGLRLSSMSLHKYPADISKYHTVNITGFSISYVMW